MLIFVVYREKIVMTGEGREMLCIDYVQSIPYDLLVKIVYLVRKLMVSTTFNTPLFFYSSNLVYIMCFIDKQLLLGAKNATTKLESITKARKQTCEDRNKY